MLNKKQLRKKYFSIRKKRYYEIKSNFFNPLIQILKKKVKKRFNISCYYPTSFEVNIFKIFETKFEKKFNILLPVVDRNNSMFFYKWKEKDILNINQYGILEPFMSMKHEIPDIMLVPLLAFDNQNNRLGYGRGYYDRYLNKYLRKNKKNILTIGVAFSFQKYHKLPASKNDVRLDHILTEKGII